MTIHRKYVYRNRVIRQALGCLIVDSHHTIEHVERNVSLALSRIAFYGYLWHMQQHGWVSCLDHDEHGLAITLTYDGSRHFDQLMTEFQSQEPE